MGFIIYKQYCKSGFHMGIDDGVKKDYARSVGDNSISSYVEIEFHQGIQPTNTEIDKSVDEFYSKIGSPSIGQQYSETVNNGNVKLMADKGFGLNATAVKQILHTVLTHFS